MRVTRIDIEGAPGRYAIISRSSESDRIKIEFRTPDVDDEQYVHAADPDGQRTIARRLQQCLEEIKGSPGSVQPYLAVLKRLAE